MAKRAFDKIMAGLTEAVDIAEGRADPSTYRLHIPRDIDTKAIRAGMGLTQADFAARYGLPVGNVRDWEQGRSVPDQAARAFLIAIQGNPTAVAEALASQMVALGYAPLSDDGKTRLSAEAAAFAVDRRKHQVKVD